MTEQRMNEQTDMTPNHMINMLKEQILEKVKKHGEVNYRTLRRGFRKVSKRKFETVLKQLEEEGIIKVEWVTYQRKLREITKKDGTKEEVWASTTKRVVRLVK